MSIGSLLAEAAPASRLALARLAWRRPEWWVVAASATAWTVLVAAELTRGRALHDHAAPAATSSTALAVSVAATVGQTMVMTLGMAVAMMVPLVVPSLRHLAGTSLWPRRHRAQVWFLGGYLGVWMLAGTGIAAGAGIVTAVMGSRAGVVAAVAVAVVWQWSATKRRALRRCARTVPLPPRGRAADRACAKFGASSAATCVTTCWAVMAVGAAAGHGVIVMALLTAALVGERTLTWRPTALASGTLVAAGVLAVLTV